MGTAILVASAGGHLSELLRLQKRLVDYERFVWAVPDTAQTMSLIGEGPSEWELEAIPDLKSRDLRGAVGLLGRARALVRREEPTLVLSTGAAPAVPFLLAAASKRVPAYYVESLARLEGPSLSARLLRPVPGVTLCTQHESLNWRGWSSVGLGTTYRSAEKPRSDKTLQVVVTVGTTEFDYRALFARLVDLLPADAEVTWQVGYSDIDGLGLVGAERLISPDVMAARMQEADVVIAHAGVGSALDALDSGCLPILVPRRLERGEHIDDHQVEVAHWLQGLGLAIAPQLDDLSLEHIEMAATTSIAATGPPSPLRLS